MKKRVISPIPIQNSAQIDLDHHSIIEASAGTGKTYTIEHLVVDLLKNDKVCGLDEILAVTYTEKAAGELRERIRTNISKILEQEHSGILQTALDTFDSASIYTIHGFCNKILQEYAFENGGQFEYVLIDDMAVYRKMLLQIMRDIWPARYGEMLRSILELSQFPGTPRNGESPWMQQVIEVAVRFQPSGNDVLFPPDGTDIMTQISELETAARSHLDALVSMAGPIDGTDIAASDLCVRYATLNIRKQSIPKRIRIFLSLLRLLAAHRKDPASLCRISDFLSEKDVASIQFSELCSGWNKSGSDYETKLPRLPEIIDHLDALRSMDLSRIRKMLAAETVLELKKRAAHYKESEGLISYDDMVTRVHDALSADSGTLKGILQRRYRYALVDEFQDTDMLQWKIFRSIFLDSGSNRLFLIGDPKQAIYGFRGADINAYYTARDEMITRFSARYYRLSENWRSSPSLIHIYNRLFADGNWFSDSAIHYQPIRYPDAKQPDAHTGTESLFLVGCGRSSGSAAKFMFADFIVREITSIISKNPDTNLNDIAILVTKWREAEAVEKYFKKANIKYSFYKKEGLYQSQESLEISYILSAIARPRDPGARKLALMTRFFAIPIASLYHFDATDADHPLSVLFEHWIECASMKAWPRLFQSILDDTGVLYRLGPGDYDRTVINYRSIFQTLEIESFRSSCTIHELSDYLIRLRSRNSYAHDSYNIQKIDIDNPGVQILTVHASKGLEFKTVFIAGGFTRGGSQDYWTYHLDGKKTYDLVMDPRHQDIRDAEQSGEEERLFYVALTRARDRLYIPLFEPTSRALASSGILGNKFPDALKMLFNDEHVSLVDCELPREEIIHAPEEESRFEPFSFPDPLLPDPFLQFLDRAVSIDSFSGLKEKMQHRNIPKRLLIEFSESSFSSGEDDAPGAMTRRATEDNEPHPGLPRTRETGLMLHQVLERIDFHEIGKAASPDAIPAEHPVIRSVIETAIHDHMNLSGTEKVNAIQEAARIIWNALHVPLSDTGLALHRIDHRLHEVEFYYTSSLPRHGTDTVSSNPSGFIHGFIDMIFLHEKKIYVVDWKSNFIEQGYSPSQLGQNIEEMHYDLQIKIYTEAVLRWMKRVLPDYTYDRHFGGVFYLYLRGMNIDTPGHGIYFYRPADEITASNLSIKPAVKNL